MICLAIYPQLFNVTPILEELLQKYRWEGLAYQIDINCFKENPTINSSLKFLRKTPWARKKVEDLYLDSFY
ncbi:MAG: VF530 family protein [Bacteroidia bacterium]|nr:VF530 family protein [Bacteroidia bacterium]